MSNLVAIEAAGGLWCDRLRIEKAPRAVSIAHQHIKIRRAIRPVQTLTGQEIAAGGQLADYVPFYFAPRSPMLFTIHCGNVEGYTEGERPIIHLETSVEKATSIGKSWCFTDGHAEMDISEFSDDLNCLPCVVDWEVMRKDYWNDTTNEPDRKRRRQAEFLVHEFFPWIAVVRIGVKDADIQKDVQSLLLKARHCPEIVVKPDWYY